MGIGIAFLISIVRPVINDRFTMGQVTGLPVLGTVSMIRTVAQKKREFLGRVAFVSLTFCLLLVFAGINLKYGFDIDLIAKIKS